MWLRQRNRAPGWTGRARGAADGVGAGTDGEPDPRRWLIYTLVAPVLGLVGIVVYAWSVDSGSVFAVALLVAFAAFLVGGLLGFLFGIPRFLATDGGHKTTTAGDGDSDAAQTPTASPYGPNTNLEQISDWLTKILVGVGLVELGKLTTETRGLVDFLAPGLGGSTSSSPFALALLVSYAISGFLIVYLVTRFYLGSAFALADQLTNRLKKVERAQQQQERDIAALTLATRYLDADPTDVAITQDELNAAVTAASDLARVQIFSLGRQRRRQGTTVQKKQSIGVFNALIASDEPGIWHRNHGQLGYALLEVEHDYAGAEAAFSTAIERRDQTGRRGFEIYELMRALARIAQDPTSKTQSPSDTEVAQAIVDDLRTAHQSRSAKESLRERYRNDPRLKAWMSRNNLTEANLNATPGADPAATG